MWNEFQAFAVKGNMIDMAVGIMIGAAFGTVVKSIVDDVVMPPLGILTGGLDLSDRFIVLKDGDPTAPYETLVAATEAGAVLLRYGSFLNAVISFFLIAVVLFVLVRWTNKLRDPDTPPAPESRACSYCMSVVHKNATSCPHCTSELVLEAA
ncbi:MAG: large conductance mechanosensitive channel protein MscL [Deltaproteobacteria bacterium]|nr:large conductance mechanosensitive channel protein MscL [Deltaproteobacteria bacterium]